MAFYGDFEHALTYKAFKNIAIKWKRREWNIVHYRSLVLFL